MSVTSRSGFTQVTKGMWLNLGVQGFQERKKDLAFCMNGEHLMKDFLALLGI